MRHTLLRGTGAVRLTALIVTVGVVLVGCGHSAAPAQSGRGTLIVDFVNQPGLPANFRTTGMPLGSDGGSAPSVAGLAELHESGSTAPSAEGFRAIQETLPPGRHIDVDLRQETHLYVNGMVVSWYGPGDDANMGMSKQAVLNLQDQRARQLRDDREITFGGPHGKPVPPITGPRTVQTEQQAATEAGMEYAYFPVPDRHMPDPGTVDDFVAFVRDLPPDTWLHFHCRAGHGRTTTFMALYDMMRNAKQVPLADILRRQYLIDPPHAGTKGAANLEKESAVHPFVDQFYQYVHDNNDDFRTPFTAWLKAHSG
ncbi:MULTISPECIES: hypothetical protein [unclassified Nocardia]|uniref:phosphatase domain-containing putative toxin n=1 Tax=unclassified Nocardia TaxID=2637762 RepID=UPI001CE3C25A|nr:MULTISPECIES: hypothetical protein [unclassified Nocardia]